jgi:hypothetical protein
MNHSEHNGDHHELVLLRRELAEAEAAKADIDEELGRIRWAMSEIEEQGPTPAVAGWMMFGRAAETVEMNAWFQAPAAGEGGDRR